jgi:hypothetical protein
MNLVIRVANVLAVLTAALSVSAAPPAASVPTVIQGLHPSRLGVDRHANLWAWDGVVVTRVSPRGDRVTSDVPAARTIDADEELGIVALTASGREARIYRWDGVFEDEIPLGSEALSVCWIDRHEIAVAPKLLDHLVEVWDTDSHTLVRTLGPTTAVPKTPGAYPAHATLLRFDAPHDELVALDSYRGEIAVYGRTGKLLRHAAFENPYLPKLTSFFATQDQNARGQGHAVAPVFWNYPSLTLTADGTIWVGDHAEGSKVNAIRIARDGSAKPVTLDAGDCASNLFQAWQGYFVYYRDPKSPRPACVGARRQ